MTAGEYPESRTIRVYPPSRQHSTSCHSTFMIKASFFGPSGRGKGLGPGSVLSGIRPRRQHQHMA